MKTAQEIYNAALGFVLAIAAVAIIFGAYLIEQDTDVIEFWQTHVETYEIN